MPPRDLILASTSTYRAGLLARLGLPFRALAPLCDEEALKDAQLAPQELAEHLALAKAISLQAAHPHAAIIGSDQVVACQDAAGWTIHGKPGGAAAAAQQLAALAGRTHRLITAMVVLAEGVVHRHTDVTTMTMRPLSLAAIDRSIARDRAFDCAGGYKIEAGGIQLFSAIASQDHTAIIGLPLIALCGILAELGFPVP